MEWTQTLEVVAAAMGGGLLTFVLGLYNARPKKNSIEIENMKMVVDELQDVISKMAESSKSYRTDTDKVIKMMKEEIKDLSQRLDIKHEAIYSSLRCDKIKDPKECIVMQTFQKRCKDCHSND